MKFTHEPIYFVFALFIACILCISCQQAKAAQYEKDTDYYDHTLNLATDLSEEQLEWEEWANQEWKSSYGEYQTQLKPEHEAEIMRKIASGKQ